MGHSALPSAQTGGSYTLDTTLHRYRNRDLEVGLARVTIDTKDTVLVKVHELAWQRVIREADVGDAESREESPARR
jgi:hypothetical protein